MKSCLHIFLSLLLVATVTSDTSRLVASQKTEEEDSAATTNNDTSAKKGTTLADKVEHLVKEEFAEDIREAEEHIGVTYNESATSGQGSVETVVRVSHKHGANGNTSFAEMGSGNHKGGSLNHAEGGLTSHEMESDVDRMIDSHDNEFVLSKPKELAALTLDPVFIQDLTILYTSAACMGLLFEMFGQPVINGYFVAGSIVGTGGFMLIQELVQVQSLAQLGVQLLLFHLGLEFSISKMHAVGGVAVFGGLLEMLVFVAIAVGSASLTGADVGIGAFIGALLSLSSTSVVANCLESSKTSSTQYGQITIGTLILQDCTVGIMFAIMPLIGENKDSNADTTEESAVFPMLLSLIVKLMLLVVIGTFISRNLLPPLIRTANQRFSQDLFQILLLSYCCLCALVTGWIGLSHELGAFVAGCMLSSSPQAPVAISATAGIRNIFMTLFMASIGLMMSPSFLWEHIIILSCSVMAVVLCKAAVIGFVVRAFGFDTRTSFLVGLSLAQISEFAFVLLSIAVDFGLLKVEMYLLLLGVTAMSLLFTPIVISVSRLRLQIAIQPLKRVTTDSCPEEEDGKVQVITSSNQNNSRTSSQSFSNPEAVQKRQSRR